MRRSFSVILLFLILAMVPSANAQKTAESIYALQITEAQSNNESGWALGFEDYIEIYNAGITEVDLSQYSLTRKKNDPFANPLPAKALQPGEYTVLVCNTDLPDLSLSKNSCSLYLYHRDGTLCDSAKLPAMKNNVWQREHGLTDQPSPGYENTAAGAQAYRDAIGKEQELIINEVVSANGSIMPLEYDYYDLIELYNAGSKTIQLSNYYLSDDKDNLTMWRLPSFKLAPGRCYVIYATGEETSARDKASFKISDEGETLYLSTRDGVCIDALTVPALTPDASYGRYENSLYYYQTPTIGNKNARGSSGITSTPSSNLTSRLLSETTQITLSGEGTLYYTLNGKTPDKNSACYDGTPLMISDSTVLRVRAQSDDKLWSPTRTYTYLFNAEKYELPIMCVSAEPGKIMGPTGIYTRYDQKNLETGANLTLIENGEEKFSVDCCLMLQGQGSRDNYKKSFQARFRSKYGLSELNYKLFDDSPVTTFNSLTLRCGSQDSYNAMLRDEFLTSLTADAMPEVLYQRYKPVNLFIDGKYFGVYHIRERVTDDYAASYLGGKNDDIDMLKGWNMLEHGSMDDFLKLLRFCKSNDLSVQENFDYVASQLSLESFMDYYIARAYTGDQDYLNIRHVRSKGGDGKWRLINFDLDAAMHHKDVGLSQMIGRTATTESLNTVIINALLENPAFRDQMLTRLAYHLRTTYAPERVLSHLAEIENLLKHDLVHNFEIWPHSYDHWLESMQDIRDYIQSDNYDRVDYLVADARKAFRMTEEEMVHYFGDLYTGQE